MGSPDVRSMTRERLLLELERDRHVHVLQAPRARRAKRGREATGDEEPAIGPCEPHGALHGVREDKALVEGEAEVVDRDVAMRARPFREEAGDVDVEGRRASPAGHLRRRVRWTASGSGSGHPVTEPASAGSGAGSTA